jgi:hypothetical protein
MALFGLPHAAGASLTADLSSQAETAPTIATAAKKKGRRGPRGRRGPAGPPRKLTQYASTVSVNGAPPANGQANCLTGKATGGGAGISNTSCSVISAGPVGPAAWGATARCPDDQTAILTVTVICAD